MTSSNEYIIGVDAGGTRTTAWIADAASECIVGRATGSSGNPRAIGLLPACQNIRNAVQSAFRHAEIAPVTARTACFCIAGAGRAAEQTALKEWFQSNGIADRIRVVTDAEAVLATATPDCVGIALICGTGSLAWGRNAAGEIRRSGGWGYLLGDEGSAFSIARAGLQAATQSADGRRPPTHLLPELVSVCQLKDPAELIEFVYSSPAPREQIARLAETVFRVAETGDACARSILDTAARQLAEMLVSVRTNLKLPVQGIPVALTGSVLTNQPLFLRAVVHHANVAESDITVVQEPVVGAVSIARSMLAEPR